MWKSTPTIYSTIQHVATLYKTAKSVAPTHVFLSVYNYSNLVKELKTSHELRYQRSDAQAQEVVSIDTFVGRLQILVVNEDSNDFVLIGRQDDYLDYVMERTVL